MKVNSAEHRPAVRSSQDDVSVPGIPLAVGVTLERLSAHTVDELGREAFVRSNLLEVLRKLAQLKRLAVYFDVHAKLWQPGKAWPELKAAEWDALFLPGVAAAAEALEGGQADGGQSAAGTEAVSTSPDEGEDGAPVRTYVLQPVDGSLRYLRRGRQARTEESQAVQEVDLQLRVISVHFSRAPTSTALQTLTTLLLYCFVTLLFVRRASQIPTYSCTHQLIDNAVWHPHQATQHDRVSPAWMK